MIGPRERETNFWGGVWEETWQDETADCKSTGGASGWPLGDQG